MRIAYFSHYFMPEIGAPSARIYELGRQWLESGHQVDVATCFPNHPAGKRYPGYSPRLRMRENIDGIEVYRHWTYITPNKGIFKKFLGHASFWPSAVLLTNAGIPKPDVVIGTSPTFFAAMAASSLARRHRVPFVMEVRDLWPAIFVDLGIVRRRALIRWLEEWERHLYRSAAAVVTVTESFCSHVIGKGVPASSVHAVLNGADVDFWRPVDAGGELRSRLSLEGRFVVLYLGAHGISHALVRILEAAQLLRDLPAVRFVFVGDGAEKDDLVQAAKQMGLPNVLILDPAGKEAVREYYSVADVCLVPLRNVPLFDTFIPSKIFEIMSMERPAVASLRGEAAEILRRSGGAIVVEPEDAGAIAGGIRYLHDHPEEARAMGRRARQFVVGHYSRRSLAARYLEILGETIAAPRVPR
jgi:glycosyltransferase involved in cell wall biosynthesis